MLLIVKVTGDCKVVLQCWPCTCVSCRRRMNLEELASTCWLWTASEQRRDVPVHEYTPVCSNTKYSSNNIFDVRRTTKTVLLSAALYSTLSRYVRHLGRSVYSL